MFNEIGIEYIDHIAVTTTSFEETIKWYLSIPGARLDRGPGTNPTQNVLFAFIKLPKFGRVEILGFKDQNSPIARHASKQPGPYHYCYGVKDIHNAVKVCRSLNIKVVSGPTEDVAFDNRKVAFLFHSDVGLFELVESQPASEMITTASSAVSHVKRGDSLTAQSEDQLGSRLENLVQQLLPNQIGHLTALSAESCLEWDSAFQLELMMLIEEKLEIPLDVVDLKQMTSFKSVLTLLKERAKNSNK